MHRVWQPIIEVASHLPITEIELSAGAAVETGPVSLALAGEGPAHLFVPTPKQTRYPVPDSAPRRNVLYDL